MKGFFKKTLSMFLCFVMVFSLGAISFSADAAEKGTMRDIVLMLDISDSMAGTPFSVMKQAAAKFCEELMTSEGSNRVALVVWDYNYYTCSFSDNLSTVKTNIQNIGLGSGTNTSQALSVAKNMMDTYGREGAIKNIVLLTDGIPQHGTTTSSGPYSRSDSEYYGYANQAYNTATTITDKYNLYTLGFFHNLSGSKLAFGQRFLQDIQNAGYYEVTDPDDLEFTFGDIAGDITENKCPIVIIPGIMGSNLYISNTEYSWKTKAWPPGGNILQTAYGLVGLGDIMKNWDLFTRPYENQNDSGVTREYGAQDTYKSLVDGLCAKFGNCDKNSKDYREIYFFSYDFRQSNAKTAQELAKFINNKGFKKVDIVAHSMGGLVASNYMKSEENRSKVGKLITCGTPYEGAPKLINCILNWDVLGNKYEGGLGNAIADDFLGLAGLTKDVKSSFTSTAELCPTKNYFDLYEWYRYSHSTHTGFLGLKTTRYYDVIGYDTYKDICSNIFGSKYADAVKVQNDLNVNGYNLLTTLDNTYFVVGINQMTIGSLWFNDGDSLNSLECDDLAYEYKGDGTVPYYSATITKRLNTLDDKENRVLEVETDHGGTCSNGKALSWIYDVLESGASTISSDNQKNRSFIVVRIACPVDVAIESNGEKLCSDAQNLSVESSFGRLDILGGNDDVKMLCLSDEEALTLNLCGTDNGSMNYEIRWFNEDGTLTEKKTFSDVSISEGTLIQTSTDKDDAVLYVDKNGDGKVDSKIKSDAKTLWERIVEFFRNIFNFIKNLFTFNK